MKRILTVVVVLVTAVLTTDGAATAVEQRRSGGPRAVNGAVVEMPLRQAVAGLRVAGEVRTGYERSAFKHWVDVDGDCQDTRAEVLRQEDLRTPSAPCALTTGRWRSAYDGRVLRRARKLDIDHVVPLAEAWDSGARGWGAARREAYANDLTERRSLIAVSASTNRAKADQDPAEWLPAQGRCDYLLAWTVVKIRWRLSVDVTEKAALVDLAATCPAVRLRTHRAVVRTGGAGLDPRFDSCTEAKAHGYGPYVEGTDPEYAWYTDGDGDGLACE